jgi:acyl carrier protein
LFHYKPQISVQESFFDIGGDSLKAGQLINAMRKKLKANLSVSDLFAASTIEEMAKKVIAVQESGGGLLGSSKSLASMSSRGSLFGSQNSLNKEEIASTSSKTNISSMQRSKSISALSLSSMTDNPSKDEVGLDLGIGPGEDAFDSWEYSNKYSSSGFWPLFIQLLPMILLYPIRRVGIWFLIAWPWTVLMGQYGMDRFWALVTAILLSRVMMGVLGPLAAICIKWLIIGRYKAGRYPLWGSMYLRWWFVEQTLKIMGTGIFSWDLPVIGPSMMRFYYIMLGAKIGNNTKISKSAKLGKIKRRCYCFNHMICLSHHMSILKLHYK